MQVSKKEGKIIDKAIKHWTETEVISESEGQATLMASYEVTFFDWKRVAKYSFWLAIACIVISVSTALFDQWLIELFKKLFDAPDSVKCAGFAVLSGGLYFFGASRKSRHPNKVYSNEAIFFLAVVSTAVSIAFLGQAIDTGSGHFSLLLLLAAIIYGVLGLWFPSTLVVAIFVIVTGQLVWSRDRLRVWLGSVLSRHELPAKIRSFWSGVINGWLIRI